MAANKKVGYTDTGYKPGVKPTPRKASPTKPKVGMTTPKAKPKITPPAAPKRKYTKSEQNFLDGQKLKKKILKKTGIYPNTAN